MVTRHNFIKRFRNLNRDNAPHFLECALSMGRCFRDSKITAILAAWWGIEMDDRCKFYGLPLFRRLPGSHIHIGRNCQFRSSRWSNLVGLHRPCMLSTLTETATLKIGEDCAFSSTVIGCASKISIGKRVMCGANVTITDTDWHPLDWRDRLAGKPGQTSPTVIGDDVWLGMNVTVLKGVEIGRQTVVACGSVVTRSLPAGVMAAGQPATVIRNWRDSENLRTLVFQIVAGDKIGRESC